MEGTNFRAEYAKAVLYQHVVEKYENVLGKTVSKLPTSAITDDLPSEAGIPQEPPNEEISICVVGAGAAGLGVAIELRKLGYTNVEVLEATGRHGGRCYTHYFENGPKCAHDYYDVGAMRIPDIPTMKSTFQMIEYLQEKGEVVVKEEYIYDAKCEPSMYFYSADAPGNTSFDDFMMEKEKKESGILIENHFLQRGTGEPVDDFDKPFWDFIHSDEKPDSYSTRAFLMLQKGWSYEDVQKAEMLATSTGIFDQAFMETICDYCDFVATKNVNAKWFRIEGGMGRLTDAMYNVVVKDGKKRTGAKILYNRPVTALRDNGENQVEVTTLNAAGTTTTKKYNVVFNTTPMSALQRMDLSTLGLNHNQLTAIRALSYDRASKVAIKFSNPWWIQLLRQTKGGSQYRYGGVSSSDLSISNVVYPSWDDGPNEAHTIIVSYSWAQDATRIASLISQHDRERTDGTADPLIRLIFNNLIQLWSSEPQAADLQTTLESSYIAHHAFAWSHDPYTSGGYALFGPGQFSNLYSQFLSPLCNNKFVVCGEAISAQHAWISGALDSAYRAVMAWNAANCDRPRLEKLIDSTLGGGKGKNPAEVDETLLYWDIALTKIEEKKKLDA